MILDPWNVFIICLMMLVFFVHCIVMYAMGLKTWAAIASCVLIWGLIGAFWFGLAYFFSLHK